MSKFKVGQWVKYLSTTVPIIHAPTHPFAGTTYVIEIHLTRGHEKIVEHREVDESELSEIAPSPAQGE